MIVLTYRWPWRVQLVFGGYEKRLPWWGGPIIDVMQALGLPMVTWRDVGWKN
jgi:hypothetical protein